MMIIVIGVLCILWVQKASSAPKWTPLAPGQPVNDLDLTSDFDLMTHNHDGGNGTCTPYDNPEPQTDYNSFNLDFGNLSSFYNSGNYLDTDFGHQKHEFFGYFKIKNTDAYPLWMKMVNNALALTGLVCFAGIFYKYWKKQKESSKPLWNSATNRKPAKIHLYPLMEHQELEMPMEEAHRNNDIETSTGTKTLHIGPKSSGKCSEDTQVKILMSSEPPSHLVPRPFMEHADSEYIPDFESSSEFFSKDHSPVNPQFRKIIETKEWNLASQLVMKIVNQIVDDFNISAEKTPSFINQEHLQKIQFEPSSTVKMEHPHDDNSLDKSEPEPNSFVVETNRENYNHVHKPNSTIVNETHDNDDDSKISAGTPASEFEDENIPGMTKTPNSKNHPDPSQVPRMNHPEDCDNSPDDNGPDEVTDMRDISPLISEKSLRFDLQPWPTEEEETTGGFSAVVPPVEPPAIVSADVREKLALKLWGYDVGVEKTEGKTLAVPKWKTDLIKFVEEYKDWTPGARHTKGSKNVSAKQGQQGLFDRTPSWKSELKKFVERYKDWTPEPKVKQGSWMVREPCRPPGKKVSFSEEVAVKKIYLGRTRFPFLPKAWRKKKEKVRMMPLKGDAERKSFGHLKLTRLQYQLILDVPYI